jgi:tetratricopeptide (TPR) repeat protein
LNRIGIAYQAQLNARDARKFYERAIKVDKTFAPAINNLGSLYYNQKRYGKAIRQYKRAIQIDGGVASFHSNLAYAYLGEKKYNEMMVAFRRALELDPTIFDRRNRAGSVVLERSVEDHGAFSFYLAKTFAQMGNAERCADFLKKARDEGFKNVAAVKTDPAFAGVRAHPAVKNFLDSLTATPSAGAPPSSTS